MHKTKLDSASEQNILNMLMDNSIITSDQMSKINLTSSEIGKSKLETAFELNLANEDEILNILDVVALVNAVLSDEYIVLGDMNEDGIINILDIVILINIILNP